MINFDTAHGKATPELSNTAEPLAINPPAVKNVSSETAGFQPNRAPAFQGSASDFSSKHPVKGVGSSSK